MLAQPTLSDNRRAIAIAVCGLVVGSVSVVLPWQGVLAPVAPLLLRQHILDTYCVGQCTRAAAAHMFWGVRLCALHGVLACQCECTWMGWGGGTCLHDRCCGQMLLCHSVMAQSKKTKKSYRAGVGQVLSMWCAVTLFSIGRACCFAKWTRSCSLCTLCSQGPGHCDQYSAIVDGMYRQGRA